MNTGSLLSLHLKTWFPNLAVDVLTCNDRVVRSMPNISVLLVHAILLLQELSDKKINFTTLIWHLILQLYSCDVIKFLHSCLQDACNYSQNVYIHSYIIKLWNFGFLDKDSKFFIDCFKGFTTSYLGNTFVNLLSLKSLSKECAVLP